MNSKRSSKNVTLDTPSSPRPRFRTSTTKSLGEQGQRHFPVCSRWNISSYLPTTQVPAHHYAWYNKEFEEFPTSFAQVSIFYPTLLFILYLEYWHLRPGFSSGNIMVLTWCTMPHSKPNSSPSFELRSKKQLWYMKPDEKGYDVDMIFCLRKRWTCILSFALRKGMIFDQIGRWLFSLIVNVCMLRAL